MFDKWSKEEDRRDIKGQRGVGMVDEEREGGKEVLDFEMENIQWSCRWVSFCCLGSRFCGPWAPLPSPFQTTDNRICNWHFEILGDSADNAKIFEKLNYVRLLLDFLQAEQVSKIQVFSHSFVLWKYFILRIPASSRSMFCLPRETDPPPPYLLHALLPSCSSVLPGAAAAQAALQRRRPAGGSRVTQHPGVRRKSLYSCPDVWEGLSVF